MAAGRVDKRGRRYYRRGADACGCCHDEILKAVAGTPHEGLWRNLITLHLSDDRGQPMHAVTNACYHLGIGKHSEKHDAHAQSHLRLTDEQFADLRDALAGLASDAEREAHVQQFVHHTAAAWRQEAQRGVEALRHLAETNITAAPGRDR